MPIERKDRSFNKIFDEVSLDSIPFEYIKSVKLFLIDGTEIDIEQEDLAEIGNTSDLIQNLTREDVVDIAIAIDYELIQTDVTKNISAVLNTLFEDD